MSEFRRIFEESASCVGIIIFIFIILKINGQYSVVEVFVSTCGPV
jgi:hypothetical protein